MKKYKDHAYADCPDPKHHHKAAHRLIDTKPAPQNTGRHTPTHKGEISTTTNELREIWDGGYLIGYAINDPQADKIVKAVNCHEEMLNALKQVQIIVDAQGGADRLGIAIAKVIAKAAGRQT